jgi:primosomal protein N'
LVRILLAHKGLSTVNAFATELTGLINALTQKLSLPIRVQGPFPPPMERLVELYRVEIILFAATPAPLQRLLASLRARGVLASKQVAVAVDVDPIHML